jgi:hypothetical protein
MSELQWWLFLALLSAFYGRLPVNSRLERIGNLTGKVCAVIFALQALRLLSVIHFFGWRIELPSW